MYFNTFNIDLNLMNYDYYIKMVTNYHVTLKITTFIKNELPKLTFKLTYLIYCVSLFLIHCHLQNKN